MQKLHDRRCKGDSFAPLEYFTEVSNNDRALRYLKNNNCLSAYENRFTKIMYEPKWYRYGKSHTLFTCGDSDTAIVVEDAASACAVSQTFTGVALLGTNLKDMDLSLLKKFHKVYICLDPDATRKALDIQKYLCYVVPTKVIRIKDDLKYFGSQEIKKLVLNNNL